MSEARAQGPASAPRAAAWDPFPSVPAEHRHARELLANALRYVAPENGMIDPNSGYPFEGWNQEPSKGLFLRSFTQLTAIGQLMELLADIAAGECEVKGISRDQALARLAHLVQTLRKDQRDPKLSDYGLLGNFLDLATGKRLGPLAVEATKQEYDEKFGRERADRIWKGLQEKGWIVARKDADQAEVKRSATYGSDFFDGPLAPFADAETKQAIMGLLDHRVVLAVFIDNANLSASAAKTIGALLGPAVKDHPAAAPIREQLERFLDDQQEGYARLYDPVAGQFYFGWDATHRRHFGWFNDLGRWVTGHVDYLVNEFRGPATFVVTRFGLPFDALANLGFKMKPYRLAAGRTVHVLAPWEGSAFQAFGLDLSLTELSQPSWKRLLDRVVDVEIDFSRRHSLPGFLSESYSGQGEQYTGSIGIPDIAVSPAPRITDAASLYTLGAAYSIAPEKVERFLGANWPAIAPLLTDHGPWEGYNTSKREVIAFQTTAHTLALALGLLHTSPDHMRRYLESKNLTGRLQEVFEAGSGADLLSESAQVFAWNGKAAPMTSRREPSGFLARTEKLSDAGIAFVPQGSQEANLSGGVLVLRYRSDSELPQANITLKPVKGPLPDGLIPTEIFTRFEGTGKDEAEIRIPLPATPGLAHIKEVVITFGQASQGRPLDLTIRSLKVQPAGETD
ncbi:MAG: hypothetical protein U0790_09750 [Isosphaeraceae bacterium]